MYEVFMDNKSVVLTDQPNIEVGEDKYLYIQYDDFEELHFVLDMLTSIESLKGAVFHHHDLEVLFTDFRAHFKELDAAGGVVVNELDEVLLIHRRGKWDLPKGKVEIGETQQEAALREVAEECGIVPPENRGHLIDTYHVYHQNGDRILKKTEWFSMFAHKEALTPQAVEQIDKAIWVSVSELDIESLDTYRNIRKVLHARFDR